MLKYIQHLFWVIINLSCVKTAFVYIFGDIFFKGFNKYRNSVNLPVTPNLLTESYINVHN